MSLIVINWLVGRVGRLWADLIIALMVAAIVLAPFVMTYRSGSSNCEHRHETADLKASLAVLQTLATLNARGAGIAGDYVLRRDASEIVYRRLLHEVPHVVTVYRPRPRDDAVPLPNCVFTRGFIGLWNDADKALVGELPDGGSGFAVGGSTTDPAQAVGDADKRR